MNNLKREIVIFIICLLSCSEEGIDIMPSNLKQDWSRSDIIGTWESCVSFPDRNSWYLKDSIVIQHLTHRETFHENGLWIRKKIAKIDFDGFTYIYSIDTGQWYYDDSLDIVITEKEICWQSSINGPELVLSGCGLNRLMKDTSAFNLISGMWYRQRIPWKKI